MDNLTVATSSVIIKENETKTLGYFENARVLHQLLFDNFNGSALIDLYNNNLGISLDSKFPKSADGYRQFMSAFLDEIKSASIKSLSEQDLITYSIHTTKLDKQRYCLSLSLLLK